MSEKHPIPAGLNLLISLAQVFALLGLLGVGAAARRRRAGRG